MVVDIFEIAVRIFILLAPFFVLSVFVTLTENLTIPQRRVIAIKSTLAILVSAFIVYFVGEQIMDCLGINLNAFRMGAGLVLLLSGLEMVRGAASIRSSEDADGSTISVVPIAIPCAIGPGTVGALLVMGKNPGLQNLLIDGFGILIAVLVLGAILYFSNAIEQLIRRKGLVVMSKLTGLFLVALAVQIIVSGIQGFFPNL